MISHRPHSMASLAASENGDFSTPKRIAIPLVETAPRIPRRRPRIGAHSLPFSCCNALTAPGAPNPRAASSSTSTQSLPHVGSRPRYSPRSNTSAPSRLPISRTRIQSHSTNAWTSHRGT
jgi:hypothetical protein